MSHRFFVAALFAFVLAGIYTFQSAVWSAPRAPDSIVDLLVIVISFTWLVSLPAAIVGLVGLIWYRRPTPPTSSTRQIDTLVSFRIVSRGQNAEALRSTVRNVRSVMAEAPRFPYRIEVVTDLPVELEAGLDLIHILVPESYRSPRESRYKARALQYALETSDLPEKAWIMHLDEESHITPSLVAGIQEAVEEEDRRAVPRIGQGAILYHRDLDEQTFLTLADSIRVGDDLGRFHFQHRLGQTIFGLHGSFILVRNDIERDVGFDFGPRGSITEDAFWALVQMERGRRSRWVDGYVVEQATRSIRDFVKQRRRWFVGIALVVLHAPVARRFRAGLLASITAWSLSWVGLIAVVVNLLVGVELPPLLRLAGNLTFAYYLLLYLIGLRLMLQQLPPTRLLRRVRLFVGQLALMPVYAVMEAAGVVYGILRPDVLGFHVVKK